MTHTIRPLCIYRGLRPGIPLCGRETEKNHRYFNVAQSEAKGLGPSLCSGRLFIYLSNMNRFPFINLRISKDVWC